MQQSDFNRIKKFVTNKGIIKRVGWAIWDPKNINNVPYSYSSISSLKNDRIIVGLNASKNTANDFGAFHCRHRGGRDSWLMEATKGTPFEGAYMTDVYKVTATSVKHLRKQLKNNPTLKKAQQKLIEDEIRTVVNGNTVGLEIKVIGDDAYDDLMEIPFFQGIAANIKRVPHYSGFGITKKNFIINF